jgi:hypothetical protein
MRCNVKILILLGFLIAVEAYSQVPGKPFNPAETQVMYLSGTGPDDAVEWDFFCSAGRKSGYWTTINVPSCWEQEGFGNYNYGVNFYGKETDPGIPTEQGFYKYEFTLPEAWRGRRIRIVFEGVMTDTRVLINGQKAGSLHQGGFYRFAYDISNLVKFDDPNLLEVTVSKESENGSVNLAERRADYWNFGGIFRPVFLESKPSRCIDRAAIDARADGSFLAEVYTGEAYPEEWSVEAELYSIQEKRKECTVRNEIPAGSDKVILKGKLSGVKTWTAETPHLYTLIFYLKRGDEVVHRITERIGFRTFEIRKGEGFYLNGQRILLKGINRHSFRPETGRTLSKEQNCQDVRLIKEMNMNTVRMSHYPPNPEFLDACDELGLYVLNELAGWHGAYDTGVGRELVRELVVRDVNHPSIIFWDNGNEGGWNTELDDEFGKWDPGNRPVLHPQQDLNGVETMHYRSYGETREYLRGKDIFFPTEILHGLYDGGHGAGLYDYWEMMRTHPRCGGALLWVFADEGVVRTDQGGRIDNDGNHGADGILGPHLEKEGSFLAVKEIWAPIVVRNQTIHPEFNGEFEMENRYDFINLNQCTFEWEWGAFSTPQENKTGHLTLKNGKTRGPSVEPHETGTLKIDFSGRPDLADVLCLKAIDPEGREVWTWSWNIIQSAGISGSKKETLSIEKTADEAIVRAGEIKLHFSNRTGELEKVTRGEKKLSFGKGPRFVAFRRGDRSLDGWVAENLPKGVDRIYNKVPEERELLNFRAEVKDGMAIIEASCFGPLRNTKWTIHPNGVSKLEYSYRYDGVVELMGIKFDYPEEEVLSKRWLGEGPYRVWQNRMHGTRIDVWENTYNDPVPGETFVYPEFKGYFGNWNWVKLKTTEGNITLSTEGYDSFLGIYTPRDGRDALLYTFPESGIAILDVIPAVRNKVNATDLIGPSSKPQYVEGVKTGTLYFQFDVK